MKKVSLVLGALALVLGLSQCNKEKSPVQAGEKQYIEVTASNGNDGSKVNVDFASVPTVMNLTWEKGDVITVSGGAVGTLTLDEGAGTAQGHFSGEIEKMNDNELVFSYKKAAQERGDENPNLPDFNSQDGTQAWIKDNLYLETKAAYNESGRYSLLMEMPYAVLKLDLSGFAATTKTGGTTVTISINGSVKASVTNITSDSKAVYVAISADETPSEKVYTFNANGVVASAPWKLETNTFYTKKGEGGTPTGESVVIVPVAPVFSVAADKTVVFSKGNLWYDGNKFHFEDSQTAYTTTWDASHVGLFRWSPKRSEAVSSSGDELHYESGVFFTNSKGTTANPDFQVDGEVAGTWRTLSRNELDYLLNTDNAPSGARTDANRFARARVNDVNGLLIFPDKYNNGTAVSGITGVAEVNYAGKEEFPTSNIPAETWTTMESCGVVFLPASGFRNGKSFSSVNTNGSYWLSSWHDSNNARCVRFYLTEVRAMGNLQHHGYSVRLVR